MKRLFSILLVFCLCLSGCTLGERIKEPVSFYYLRSDYVYFSYGGVVASEEREASGHKNDLDYLLALYLLGPSKEGLALPLPKNTKIYNTTVSDKEITLQFSNLDSDITDADFSLACACLAMTCFDITDVETVTVKSGERAVSLTRSSISLFDNGINTAEENK